MNEIGKIFFFHEAYICGEIINKPINEYIIVVCFIYLYIYVYLYIYTYYIIRCYKKYKEE